MKTMEAMWMMGARTNGSAIHTVCHLWHHEGMLPALTLALSVSAALLPPALDDGSVIELIMVDRFADGAPNADEVMPGHLRRFQGGDLAGLSARLPWLLALGVSHVWLTPLHRQVPHLVGHGDDATAAFHGYWPEDFTSVDPHFGTVVELTRLVNEALDAKLGVIVDLVVNHTGYGASDPRHLVRAVCGHGEQQGCLFGLPDLRTEDPRVRAAVVDDVGWWLQQAPFAGVRLDAFKHIDIDTAVALTARIHSTRPGAVVIAERWGATMGDVDVGADIAAGAADAAFDFGLMGLARDFVNGRLRGQALGHHLEQRCAAAARSAPMLTFLDNHDTETWTHATGTARAPLGAPLLLLTPGIPVLTWGTELARLGGAKDPDNRSMMPWEAAADAETDPSHPLHWWRRLVALRRTSPAARHGTLTVLGASPVGASSWVVFERKAEGERLLTAIAVGSALRHCEPTREGEAVVDTIAWPPHAAALAPGPNTICVSVPADGAVVVRLRTSSAASAERSSKSSTFCSAATNPGQPMVSP
jgi:glycosidase